MKLVVMGHPVGKDGVQRIAAISVRADGQLVVEAEDPRVSSELVTLVEKQIASGGFVYHTGRYEPSQEQPQTHITYVVKQGPRDPYFGRALMDTVARFWTGRRLGGYEINGFASYIED